MLIGLVLLATALGAPSSTSDRALSLTVIAHADARGELEPCACPGQAGGLALRGGLIQKLRARPHPAILVDAGDFVAGPADSAAGEATPLMLEVMDLLDYDAVGVGEEELLLGPGFFLETADRIPWVLGNLAAPESLRAAVPRSRSLDTEAGRIVVTAWLDPVTFYTRPEAWRSGEAAATLLDPVEALAPILAGARERGEVVIVLAHAPVASIPEVLEDLPPVDVVVAGHRPEGERAPVRLGSNILLVPGERSRTIVSYTFTPGPGGDARYRLHDLKRSQGVDARIEALVRSRSEP